MLPESKAPLFLRTNLAFMNIRLVRSFISILKCMRYLTHLRACLCDNKVSFVASIKAPKAAMWSCLKVVYNISPQTLCAGGRDVCPYRQQLLFELVSFIEATTKHVTYPKGTCGVGNPPLYKSLC